MKHILHFPNRGRSRCQAYLCLSNNRVGQPNPSVLQFGLPCKPLFPQALELTQALLVRNRMLLPIGYRFLFFHCHPKVIFVEISLMCHCSYLQVWPTVVPAKALIASELLHEESDVLSSIPLSPFSRHSPFYDSRSV